MTNLERENKLAVAKEKLKWLLSEEKSLFKRGELSDIIRLVTDVKQDILMEINNESGYQKRVDNRA